MDPNSEAAKEFALPAVDWVVGNDGTGIIKGRMKFCRPIFRDVARADKVLAANTFKKYKNSFHPIAQKLIEKVRLLRIVETLALIGGCFAGFGDCLRRKSAYRPKV